MPMEIFMKDSGKRAQKMVLEFIDFQMEIYMKETGILISIKDMAKSLSKTDLILKENLLRA
jgi:hypothetical protein